MIEFILLELSLDTRGYTVYHRLFALSVLIGLAVLMLIAVWRWEFEDLPEEQAKRKEQLQGQIEDTDPKTLRIPATEDLETYRDNIRALFDDKYARGVENPTTVREATRSTWAELGRAWRDRTESIPTAALRFIEEGLAILVLGLLAVVPVDIFVRAFSAGEGASAPDTGQQVMTGLSETTDIFLTTAVELLAAFPFGGFLWSLAFTFGILLVEFLYYRPWLTGGSLIALGVAVWLLERDLPDSVDTGIYQSRRGLGLAVTRAVALIWAAGVIPATMGRWVGTVDVGLVGITLGFEIIGAVVGLLFAFVVAIGQAVVATRTLWQILWERAEEAPTTASTSLVSYLVVRRVATVMAALLAPFIVLYAAVLVFAGRAGELVAAFAGGSLVVQLTALLLVVAAVAFVLFQIRDVWPDIRDAIRDATAQRAVKLAIFLRGFPVLSFAFTYFIFLGFGASMVLAALLSAFVAVVVHRVSILMMRARRKARLYESEDKGATRAVIHAYTLKLDEDENEYRYYARVNTVAVAHETLEGITDAIIDISESLFEDNEADPHVARQYAEDLLEYGIVDIDETEDKLRRSVYEDSYLQVKRQPNEMLDGETVDDKLEEYPEEIRESMLTRLKRRGELLEHDGYYYIP